MPQQPDGDRQTLPFAAGKRQRMPFAQFLERKRLFHARDALVAFGRASAARAPACVAELRIDRIAEQLIARLLHDEIHLACTFAGAQARASQLDRPRLLFGQAGHATKQGGFSRTVATDDADDPPRLKREIAPVQNRGSIAVSGNHAPHAHDGIFARRKHGAAMRGRQDVRRNGRVDFGDRRGAQPQALRRDSGMAANSSAVQSPSTAPSFSIT